MRSRLNIIVLNTVLLFSMSKGWGQSAAGDIAFTAFNVDGDNDFAFVALVAISDNTVIYFTDNEWDGDSFTDTNEGYVTWTATSNLSVGSVIVVTDASGTESVNTGTVSETGNFDLGASNECLFALSAAPATSYGTTPTFYAAISNDEDANANVLTNTGLTSGTHTIDFDNDHDGFAYTGDRTGQSSFSDYLAIINNTSNWQDETSDGEQILPISTTVFSLGVTISGNSGFRMMSSPVAGQIYSDLLAELWTQGMTGADVSDGTANVWTFDVSGQYWSALSNLNTASLTAGQGFMVYVFADTDNDGDDDLPVTLSVSGTENSSSVTVPSSGSIADQAYELAGNPYASTIDWDDVTKTNIGSAVYVWDNAASTYKSWNGSSGGLTDGLIAPYQGFWVQASGGGGSITIETSDKSSTAGTFYTTTNDGTGSMSFSIAYGDYSDKTYVSFMTHGEEGIDNSEAYKLLPMTPTNRVVALSYVNEQGIDINNLPYSYEGTIDIPLDIMSLTVDADYNFVTHENEVTMSWDLSHLPETITGLTLIHNTTNETTDLLQGDDITFSTTDKGNFPAYGNNDVNVYPLTGESLFTLSVHYSALAAEESSTYPTEFALYPAYPNPFNPSATITFDAPNYAAQSTQLQIFNINGQLVETLINKQLAPGAHTLHWNPSYISSGVYFLQLTQIITLALERSF